MDKKREQEILDYLTQEADNATEKCERVGLDVKQEDNLAQWYWQVLTKGEMLESYDVMGCYVLRPWSYFIWERLSAWFDAQIKEIGFENCYFPLFISARSLEREKEHTKNFASEFAWVTKISDSTLDEPLAVRVTSETAMYPSFARWVQSHRDLPIKLNQWCNVVRWELKQPEPFLRTREFLWQEGHSAYATHKEAEEEAATAHNLGQKFSTTMNISFEDPVNKRKKYAYQNSWGISTRSIGIMVMVHGDNKGLVLPPRIAHFQVVIVPCGLTDNLPESDRKNLFDKCGEVAQQLKAVGVRVKEDYRDNYSPGWKFNHWELKGVPIRLEVGPKDLEKKQCVTVRRDTGDKNIFSLGTGLNGNIQALLDKIHDYMYTKAKKDLDTNQTICSTFEEFCSALDKNHIILSPFCGEIPCEEKIKKLSPRDAMVEEGAPSMGAKGLCIPFKQPKEITVSDKCIGPGCTNKPKCYTLFGRSY